MPAKSERELVRICTRIYRDDYDALKDLSKAAGDAGRNALIRECVSSYVRHIQDAIRTRLDTVAPVDINLAEIELDLDDFKTAEAIIAEKSEIVEKSDAN